MQLKKLFLLLLPLAFFVSVNVASAASSCSGQFGSWCGPQNSNEMCCTAEQCTGSSCSSAYPGCGQYGANARIGQCDYKCLEGVLRLVQCDHNYATGTNCSSNISNGQTLDIGYCNYYCGNGTLQVNSCSSPIQSNSLESDNYLCHSDGTCIGSLLPGDSGCRYRVFNGQAVREYSRIWTEAMCPPSSTNPPDLTCTDGSGNVHQDGTWWEEGGCARQCDGGVIVPSVCPLNQCYIAPRLLGDIYISGGYKDHGALGNLGEAECNPLCPQTEYDAWACSGTCNDGSWTDVYDCQYKVPDELITCTTICTSPWGCVCPAECSQSTTTLNDSCGGVAPLSCGEHPDNTIWNEDFCNYRCDDGVTTKIETSCAFPNGHICEPSKPEQCISQYCGYDSRIDIYLCEAEPQPDLSCKIGNGTLANGESSYYGSSICAPYCIDSTNAPATTCLLTCIDGTAHLDSSGACVYPPTQLSDCNATCNANAGCVCSNNCNISGEITKGESCGGSLPQDCGFIGHGETGSTSGQNCYDGGCQTNVNGSPPTSCSVTCDDGGYVNASSCVYPRKSLGSCDATCNATFGCSCPIQCTNNNISLGQSCGGIPYESCSIDGFADLPHGETGQYYNFTDANGEHAPCVNYCTDSSNLPATGCNLTCDNGTLSLQYAAACTYPRTPLTNCTQTCTAGAGCTCPNNCKVEGNIARNNTCGGSKPQDCGFLAHGESGKTSSSNCYDAGCTTNTNGPAPTSCTVECNDGDYVNASSCVYPRKSLGSCDATCNATFGCSCPGTCVNSQISNGQSCGGVLHQNCSIEGFSDLKHGSSAHYFTYTDTQGEHTPCAGFCTNSTNLPATGCNLSCNEGTLSLQYTTACEYPKTPLNTCNQVCTADAGCICPDNCNVDGEVETNAACGGDKPLSCFVQDDEYEHESKTYFSGNCWGYCTDPTNEPVTTCLLECNNGDFEALNCIYPKPKLSDCNQNCTANSGCECNNSCVRDIVETNQTCGGVAPLNCNYYGIEYKHGEFWQSNYCSWTCDDGEALEITSTCEKPEGYLCQSNSECTTDLCAYSDADENFICTSAIGGTSPFNLSSCTQTCNYSYGCECPDNCNTTGNIINGDCGGDAPSDTCTASSVWKCSTDLESEQYCAVNGQEPVSSILCEFGCDTETGRCRLLDNYEECLENDDCSSGYCGINFSSINDQTVCLPEATPKALTNCTEICDYEFGCSCPNTCVDDGLIINGESCGDPLPICEVQNEYRCSLDGLYEEHCLTIGELPNAKNYCSGGCNSASGRCSDYDEEVKQCVTSCFNEEYSNSRDISSCLLGCGVNYTPSSCNLPEEKDLCELLGYECTFMSLSGDNICIPNITGDIGIVDPGETCPNMSGCLCNINGSVNYISQFKYCGTREECLGQCTYQKIGNTPEMTCSTIGEFVIDGYCTTSNICCSTQNLVSNEDTCPGNQQCIPDSYNSSIVNNTCWSVGERSGVGSCSYGKTCCTHLISDDLTSVQAECVRIYNQFGTYSAECRDILINLAVISSDDSGLGLATHYLLQGILTDLGIRTQALDMLVNNPNLSITERFAALVLIVMPSLGYAEDSCSPDSPNANALNCGVSTVSAVFEALDVIQISGITDDLARGIGRLLTTRVDQAASAAEGILLKMRFGERITPLEFNTLINKYGFVWGRNREEFYIYLKRVGRIFSDLDYNIKPLVTKSLDWLNELAKARKTLNDDQFYELFETLVETGQIDNKSGGLGTYLWLEDNYPKLVRPEGYEIGLTGGRINSNSGELVTAGTDINSALTHEIISDTVIPQQKENIASILTKDLELYNRIYQSESVAELGAGVMTSTRSISDLLDPQKVRTFIAIDAFGDYDNELISLARADIGNRLPRVDFQYRPNTTIKQFAANPPQKFDVVFIHEVESSYLIDPNDLANLTNPNGVFIEIPVNGNISRQAMEEAGFELGAESSAGLAGNNRVWILRVAQDIDGYLDDLISSGKLIDQGLLRQWTNDGVQLTVSQFNKIINNTLLGSTYSNRIRAFIELKYWNLVAEASDYGVSLPVDGFGDLLRKQIFFRDQIALGERIGRGSYKVVFRDASDSTRVFAFYDITSAPGTITMDTGILNMSKIINNEVDTMTGIQQINLQQLLSLTLADEPLEHGIKFHGVILSGDGETIRGFAMEYVDSPTVRNLLEARPDHKVSLDEFNKLVRAVDAQQVSIGERLSVPGKRISLGDIVRKEGDADLPALDNIYAVKVAPDGTIEEVIIADQIPPIFTPLYDEYVDPLVELDAFEDSMFDLYLRQNN